VQLRHPIEVHPVDRPDQRRREQNRRPRRDLLEVVYLGALTCDDAATAASGLRRRVFRCLSESSRVTQSILPTRSPALYELPKSSPGRPCLRARATRCLYTSDS
jgi:hypothetical protein